MVETNKYVKNEYLWIQIGVAKLDFIVINPTENSYDLIDAQVSILSVGVYTEYIFAELLVGSIGATAKSTTGNLPLAFLLALDLKLR